MDNTEIAIPEKIQVPKLKRPKGRPVDLNKLMDRIESLRKNISRQREKMIKLYSLYKVKKEEYEKWEN